MNKHDLTALMEQTGVENITQKFLNMIKLPDHSCKRLNYLMVLPSQAESRTKYYFPVGFGIVTSSLKASGRNVFTINLTYKENPYGLLKNTIVEKNIDVVITGGLSGQYLQLREIVDAAKSVRSEIITIVGGGIITAEPQVAMEALENADYGVFGEGEITINDLAYNLETGSNAIEVKGVICKNVHGEYLSAASREEIMDLDCLPFPDYDGFDYIEMFNRQYSNRKFDNIDMTVTTSRSCPYNCTFCFHTSGNKYRRRSLDIVFKELDWLKSRFPINNVYITDELFGNDFNYMNEFCARIKPYGLHYTISMRLDMVTDELLDIFKDSGCVTICFGVEHVSEKIIKSMRKQVSPSLIAPVFKKCFERGILPEGNIIFGDLEETPETVREALDWWHEHASLGIRLLYLMTFPGSHVYKVACERSIIKDPVQYLRDGCPLVNITKMSDYEWLEMKTEISNTRILYEDENYNPDVQKIIRTLDWLAESGKKVCVWPATYAIILFFKKMSKKFSDVAYYANINLNHQHLRGDINDEQRYQVYTPNIIAMENIELVICPRIKLINDIRKICENNYPSIKQVVSISEIENMSEEN